MLSVGKAGPKHMAVFRHAIPAIDYFGHFAANVLHRPMNLGGNLQWNMLRSYPPSNIQSSPSMLNRPDLDTYFCDELPRPSSPVTEALTVKSTNFWSGVIFVIVAVQFSAV